MSAFGPAGRELSIMIPTYNCAELLKETLEALARQTLDLSEAQIEIVDDCSTKDDPEATARKVWGSRVSFFRQPQNVTAIPNFNTCIERAEREWLYILHGDDYPTLDGLEAMQEALAFNPDARAVFGRVIFCDQDSSATAVSDSFGPGLHGPLVINPEMWRGSPAQFVGVIASRSAFSICGPFSEEYVHVADLWMWWRLANAVPVAYTNRLCGYYRSHPANHTSSLITEGVNLREAATVLSRIAKELYGSVTTAAAEGFFDPLLQRIWDQALSLLGSGDREAYSRCLAVAVDTGIDPKGRLGRREFARKARRLAARIVR
ncbi:MAG TPA: glycosyltransferase family 2 protein [Fimbriimonadaceae bacterium]|nr:glycosyltransferase family 2 protein [Fimbriimonadaceae bacterium]